MKVWDKSVLSLTLFIISKKWLEARLKVKYESVLRIAEQFWSVNFARSFAIFRLKIQEEKG